MIQLNNVVTLDAEVAFATHAIAMKWINNIIIWKHFSDIISQDVPFFSSSEGLTQFYIPHHIWLRSAG